MMPIYECNANQRIANRSVRAIRNSPDRHEIRIALASRSGVTLIELVVGLGILGVIGLAVFSFQRDLFQLNRFVEGGLSREADARKVLKQFAAEARTASPSSIGSYAIEAASPTALTFFSDVDNDGVKERLRYFLSGGALMRGVLEPSGQPLTYNPANEVVSTAVRDVTGPAAAFSYFDASYDGSDPPLASPVNIPDIRLIRMELVVDPQGSRPPAAAAYTIQATLRNLRWQ